ncbi:MAG: hypothetical protein LIP01_02105 [Tannerellaceae bacterium]|nr:hypothetical protein [Tannerellaceae bacterium]
METIFQKIIRKTGRKPISCKCQECKKQCKVPCLGTPEDIERLIDAGYGDKVAVMSWDVAKLLGRKEDPVYMVQAISTDNGCIFFENGLCILHDQGLKPTEGKLSHHSQTLENWEFSKSVSWQVAKEWLDSANARTVGRILQKLPKKYPVYGY